MSPSDTEGKEGERVGVKRPQRAKKPGREGTRQGDNIMVIEDIMTHYDADGR